MAMKRGDGGRSKRPRIGTVRIDGKDIEVIGMEDAQKIWGGSKEMRFGIQDGKDAMKALQFKIAVHVPATIMELRELERNFTKAPDCQNLRMRNQVDADGDFLRDKEARCILAKMLADVPQLSPETAIAEAARRKMPEKLDLDGLLDEAKQIVAKRKTGMCCYVERMAKSEAKDNAKMMTYRVMVPVVGLGGEMGRIYSIFVELFSSKKYEYQPWHVR